jgi:DNA polymerase III epsilon subunit-like protein
MMKYLGFDTETTGFPNNGGRICQLAAILFDKSGRIYGSMSFLFEPDGLTVLMRLFEKMLREADYNVVGHNIAFDIEMLRIENRQYAKRMGRSIDIEAIKPHCTMHLTKDTIKLPWLGRNGLIDRRKRGYKFPKLSEAFFHYNGYAFEGAHDALADVQASNSVFLANMRGAEKAVITQKANICVECLEDEERLKLETLKKEVCFSCGLERDTIPFKNQE